MNVKKYLMIVCCVIGVCLAVLSGIIVASRYLSEFSENPGEIVEDLPKASKSRANILLMGLDNGKIHTDTIMLFHLTVLTKS